MSRRVDELNMSITTSKELEQYLKKVRDLCKDLYLELSFAADELQANLSTVPGSNGAGPVSSKIRARKIARHLKRAAESQKYCGTQAVRVWREFTRQFAPQFDARRQKNRRRFDV